MSEGTEETGSQRRNGATEFARFKRPCCRHAGLKADDRHNLSRSTRRHEVREDDTKKTCRFEQPRLLAPRDARWERKHRAQSKTPPAICGAFDCTRCFLSLRRPPAGVPADRRMSCSILNSGARYRAAGTPAQEGRRRGGRSPVRLKTPLGCERCFQPHRTAPTPPRNAVPAAATIGRHHPLRVVFVTFVPSC